MADLWRLKGKTDRAEEGYLRAIRIEPDYLPAPGKDGRATIAEIADTIDAWAMDSDLRRCLGQAAKRRAADQFRADRMLEDYASINERAMAVQ